MHVRPLLEADLPPLRAMLEGIVEFRPDEVTCAMELAELAVRDPDGSGYHGFAAEQEGRLAGFLTYGPTPLAPGTWDLYWIASAAWARGKGAGSALVRAMEAALKKQKARLVRVETSSITEYEPTRTFYDRMKYLPVSVIKDFYHPGDDLVILTKRL
ncbi:MAG TPA: GNAT family N-acetyltransferase [Myxococcales bacterium]|jgi:ribosomal protein S18 acetylase RimI-like enzyme